MTWFEHTLWPWPWPSPQNIIFSIYPPALPLQPGAEGALCYPGLTCQAQRDKGLGRPSPVPTPSSQSGEGQVGRGGRMELAKLGCCAPALTTIREVLFCGNTKGGGTPVNPALTSFTSGKRKHTHVAACQDERSYAWSAQITHSPEMKQGS